MRARTLSEIASAVGGTPFGEDVRISSVVTDSRQALPGSLFIALEGAHHDGTEFVGDATRRGAVAAMVGADAGLPEGSHIRVGSTGEALMRLAAVDRSDAGYSVLAITGSNGKTSTKDLTASVLARRWRVHSSPASFNNEIGLPMTLLSAPRDAQVVVAEMGSRHKGDIATLCAIARPQRVVVTNIGVAHMEIFGSWEAIVEAGAEAVECLTEEDVALLNADDAVVSGYAGRTAATCVTFGLDAKADVRAERVELDSDGLASFELVNDSGRVPVRLSVPGEHMVSDALAAAASGLEMGVQAEAIADGLRFATISHWRMETSISSRGVRVINDAYNANPESMAAALKTARWMANNGRLIAVLGGMAELGEVAESEHDRVGELAARIGVDRLVAVGERAKVIALAAVREGMDPSDVAMCDAVDAAISDINSYAQPGDVVLCKASRVAGLERVAKAVA